MTDFSDLASLLAAYRRQAERAAATGALLSATMMIGAALESALLAFVVLHEEEVRAEGLWPKKRTKKGPEFLSLNELLRIADVRGWLRPEAEHTSGMEILRSHRYLLHPGRVLRDDMTLEVSEVAYRQALAILDGAVERLATAAKELDTGSEGVPAEGG